MTHVTSLIMDDHEVRQVISRRVSPMSVPDGDGVTYIEQRFDDTGMRREVWIREPRPRLVWTAEVLEPIATHVLIEEAKRREGKADCGGLRGQRVGICEWCRFMTLRIEDDGRKFMILTNPGGESWTWEFKEHDQLRNAYVLEWPD